MDKNVNINIPFGAIKKVLSQDQLQKYAEYTKIYIDKKNNSLKNDLIKELNSASLDLKISLKNQKDELNKSIGISNSLIYKTNSELTSIKAEISNVKAENVVNLNNFKSIIDQNLSDLKAESNSILDSFKNEVQLQNQKNLEALNILQSTVNQHYEELNKINVLFREDSKENAIIYVDKNGNPHSLIIKKPYPIDNSTIAFNESGELSCKNSFDKQNFEITEDNIVKNIGLSLSTGECLSADKIENSLANLNNSINSLIKKFNNIHGYLVSNNFKSNSPTQEQLTNFAISCISNSNNDFKILKENIPSGTKIKNTFDNHIWVFNTISVDGLTTYKWEDFGSDSICIANNDNVHGLVTGSQEKYRGYIDIKGVISINGLEDEINFILSSIGDLTTDINNYKNFVNSKFEDIEKRIKFLEGGQF